MDKRIHTTRALLDFVGTARIRIARATDPSRHDYPDARATGVPGCRAAPFRPAERLDGP